MVGVKSGHYTYGGTFVDDEIQFLISLYTCKFGQHSTKLVISSECDIFARTASQGGTGNFGMLMSASKVSMQYVKVVTW